MKKFLSTSFAALFLPFAGAFADNAIYLGTEVTRFTSTADSGATPVKIYVVYDRTIASPKLSGVAYFGFGTAKKYVKLPITDIVAVTVGDESKIGRTLTVLADARKSAPGVSPAFAEAALLKGVNSQVIIKGIVLTDLPKVLTGSAFAVSSKTGTGAAEKPALLEQIKTTARLQLDLSKASNDSNDGAGENLEAARERIIVLLKAKGYTEQVVPAS